MKLSDVNASLDAISADLTKLAGTTPPPPDCPASQEEIDATAAHALRVQAQADALVGTPPPPAGNAPRTAETVAKVKNELLAQSVDVSGACGAFRITNEVARRTGMLVLRKDAGTRAVPSPDGSCLSGDQTTAPGYATDFLIDPVTFFGFDVLGDAGGANVPQWNGPDTNDNERNRANATAPVDFPLPPSAVVSQAPGQRI